MKLINNRKTSHMGNYNQGSNRGGGRNDSRDNKPMFPAVCAECERKCEVPFKPTGNKPVLCRDCFSKGKDNGPSRDQRDNNRSFGRADRQDSERPRKTMNEGRNEHYDLEFEKLNHKLDKILQRLTPVHTRDGVKKSENEDIDEAEDTENEE